MQRGEVGEVPRGDHRRAGAIAVVARMLREPGRPGADVLAHEHATGALAGGTDLRRRLVELLLVAGEDRDRGVVQPEGSPTRGEIVGGVDQLAAERGRGIVGGAHLADGAPDPRQRLDLLDRREAVGDDAVEVEIEVVEEPGLVEAG